MRRGKYTQLENRVIHCLTNKKWETALAEALPDECPKCHYGGNFVMEMREVLDEMSGCYVYIYCNNEGCDYKEDITPYDLW